jgi:hypothetical protein
MSVTMWSFDTQACFLESIKNVFFQKVIDLLLLQKKLYFEQSSEKIALVEASCNDKHSSLYHTRYSNHSKRFIVLAKVMIILNILSIEILYC